MHTERSEGDGRKVKKALFWAAKVVGTAVVIFVVFVFGVSVGNGTIAFGKVSTSKQNKDLPADLDYSGVEKLYDTLKMNYDGDLNTEKLLDGIKTGLAEASGDPYTVYLNAKAAEDFTEQLNGTFSGIGAELGQDANSNLIVIAPIAGFPAAKAGLRPQDVIVAINDKSAADLSVQEAVTKIRGPKGTKVKLRILRNKTEDLNFTIIRDTIIIPSVKHEILEGNIGYLQISQFNEDTPKLAHEAAQEFKRKSVRGVVVDLRGNPGGFLDAAVAVSSLWLDKGGTVVQTKRNGLLVSTEVASGDNILQGVPTVVLIDAGSASASEIMAGALKDHKAATLFGVKSFGKGSVQQIEQLPGGAELKVTIARWYRPNGQNIDKKGISPDTEVKMTEDDYKNKRDPQKDVALQFIKKQ